MARLFKNHILERGYDYFCDDAVEDMDVSEDGKDIRQECANTESKDEVEEILHQANETQMRQFLSDILHNDEKLFSRFKTLIKQEVSPTDMKRYKRQVDVIINKHQGRGHYISYYEAYDFALEMQSYLDEDVRMLLDSGHYWNAFELTCYMFTEVANIDIDDSDGGISMFADRCMEVWEEILDIVDKETEEKIYQWFTGHLNGSIIDYMEELNKLNNV